MCVRSLGQEDSLEKGMATHSSILAWEIPWTGYSLWHHKSWTQLSTVVLQCCVSFCCKQSESTICI